MKHLVNGQQAVSAATEVELFSWKTTSHKYHLEVCLPNSRLLSGLTGMWSSMKIALHITQIYFLQILMTQSHLVWTIIITHYKIISFSQQYLLVVIDKNHYHSIQGFPKKMFISKKGAKLTNEHFLGHLVPIRCSPLDIIFLEVL